MLDLTQYQKPLTVHMISELEKALEKILGLLGERLITQLEIIALIVLSATALETKKGRLNLYDPF